MAASFSATFDGVAGAADADHRLARETELHRVGDRDDLHHAGVDHALDALAHRGLGQSDGLADARIGPPAVLLQFLDDRFGQLVELHAGPAAWLMRSETWADWSHPVRHAHDCARNQLSRATITMNILGQRRLTAGMRSRASVGGRRRLALAHD